MDVGFNMRVYPPGVVTSGDHKFIIELTTWDGSACLTTETIVFENVDMIQAAADQYQAKLWIRDAIEVAAQVLDNEIAKSSKPTVSGANEHVSGG